MGKAAIRGCRYPRHTAFPSRGRCPVGADRARTAGKTEEEIGEARGTRRESVSPPIPSPFSPLPIKKRTPASESANPSSQHQLDGSIVPILAKRRKVNHSRFRIATQKPLPLGKRPPAGRGIGRRMNKQPVRSYGTDYSKEHRSPGAFMPQSASNVPSPCLPFT